MLLQLLALLLILVGTLYIYSILCHSYWSKRGIQTPPSKFIIGHAHHNFTSVTPIWEFKDEAYHKYGGKEGMCGTYNFFSPSAIVGNLDLLKKILVADFDHFVDRRHLRLDRRHDAILNDILTNAAGDHWKRLRNAVTPVFTSGRLKAMFPLLKEKSDKLLLVAEPLADSEETVEMKKLAGLFLLDAIASCGFGLETNCLENPDEDFAKKAAQIFMVTKKRIFTLMCFLISPGISYSLGLKASSPIFLYFSQIVSEVLQERRRSGKRREDFLDLMLDAQENANSEGKQALEDHSLIAQAVVFLLGGFDSSANAIAFGAYHLAISPQIQQKAREEIEALVREEGGEEVTYDVLSKAKYLDACVSETLRLYPVETSFNRECTKEYKISELGLTIPKGMILEVPVWSIHRDPDIWPDPSKFDPDRFDPDVKKDRHQYAYMPFGVGQRNCIGMRFALLTVKLALAQILLSFELTSAEQQEHPPKLACSPLILRPEKGLFLHLNKREI